MTPLVVENEPPVTFLRRKMTGGRFSMGVVIRRYTGTLQPIRPSVCWSVSPSLRLSQILWQNVSFWLEVSNGKVVCKRANSIWEIVAQSEIESATILPVFRSNISSSPNWATSPFIKIRDTFIKKRHVSICKTKKYRYIYDIKKEILQKRCIFSEYKGIYFPQ